MRKDTKNRHQIFFAITLVIFLITQISSDLTQYLYRFGFVFGLIIDCASLLYAALYILRTKNQKSVSDKTLDLLFALILLGFIGMICYTVLISPIVVDYLSAIFYPMLVGTIMAFCILLPIFMGVYLIKAKGKIKRYGYLFIAIAVILTIIFFLSGLAIKSYTATDEIFINIAGVKSLFNGINPYQNSVATQLYQNRSSISLTVTTNNKIVGNLDYPALNLISFMPFYLAFPSNSLYNIQHHILPLQVAVFLPLLVIIIALCMDNKDKKSLPLFGLAILLGISIVLYASTVSFLMLLLLILAYRYADTKYSWLLFGLCISIQELLWFPVILLWLYSMNRNGWKKGAYDILGALVVFLIINGYFIALNYQSFFNGVVGTTQRLLIATENSPFSFTLQQTYPILLNTYSTLFGITILILIGAFLYFDIKRFVGLFWLIPFLILYVLPSVYFVLFALFLFIVIFIPDKDATGHITSWLRGHRLFFSSVMALLLAAFAVTVLASHSAYISQFDLRIVNQTVYYNPQLNKTVYTAQINYNNLQNRSAYITFFIYKDWQIQVLGIGNYSLISNPVKCAPSDYGCLWNVNRISFNGSAGTYNLNAYIQGGNVVKYMQNARLVIYNGKYLHVGNDIG